MGIYFRRSTKIGPFRLNFSNNGIGWSVGGKYFRYGKTAKGKRYISGGAHGLYYRENLDKGRYAKRRNKTFSAVGVRYESSHENNIPLPPVEEYSKVQNVLFIISAFIFLTSPISGLIIGSWSAFAIIFMVGAIMSLVLMYLPPSAFKRSKEEEIVIEGPKYNIPYAELRNLDPSLPKIAQNVVEFQIKSMNTLRNYYRGMTDEKLYLIVKQLALVGIIQDIDDANSWNILIEKKAFDSKAAFIEIEKRIYPDKYKKETKEIPSKTKEEIDQYYAQKENVILQKLTNSVNKAESIKFQYQLDELRNEHAKELKKHGY